MNSETPSYQLTHSRIRTQTHMPKSVHMETQNRNNARVAKMAMDLANQAHPANPRTHPRTHILETTLENMPEANAKLSNLEGVRPT